jgi:hypothetical protein
MSDDDDDDGRFFIRSATGSMLTVALDGTVTASEHGIVLLGLRNDPDLLSIDCEIAERLGSALCAAVLSIGETCVTDDESPERLRRLAQRLRVLGNIERHC